LRALALSPLACGLSSLLISSHLQFAIFYGNYCFYHFI